MTKDQVAKIIEEAMRLGRLQFGRSLAQYPAEERSADIVKLTNRASLLTDLAPPKSLAEMQQKMQRQQHATAHLQTAHNRALRRLDKVSRDLADLKQTVEMYGDFGSALHRAYIQWCVSVGVPTPEKRAASRVAALIKARKHPWDFEHLRKRLESGTLEPFVEARLLEYAWGRPRRPRENFA